VPDRHHFHNLTENIKTQAKNKVENLAKDSAVKQRPSTHHDLPATHHNFTTKTPHKNSLFAKNPLKNGPPTTQKKYGPATAGPHLSKSTFLT
jgi:hypothetical protein